MDLPLLAKGLVWFLLLFISLTVHEWAHAWVADKLGDPTPRSAGRVSLNPMVHVDWLGTVLFPLLCILFSTGIIFGWGKPVEINSRYFKSQTRGEMLVGIAGVGGNLLLCLICSVLMGVVGPLNGGLLYSLLLLNGFLVAFNCLPIPPLDGFHLAKYLFNIRNEFSRFLEQWGFFILIILLNLPFFRQFLLMVVNGLVLLFLRFSNLIHAVF